MWSSYTTGAEIQKSPHDASSSHDGGDPRDPGLASDRCDLQSAIGRRDYWNRARSQASSALQDFYRDRGIHCTCTVRWDPEFEAWSNALEFIVDGDAEEHARLRNNLVRCTIEYESAKDSVTRLVETDRRFSTLGHLLSSMIGIGDGTVRRVIPLIEDIRRAPSGLGFAQSLVAGSDYSLTQPDKDLRGALISGAYAVVDRFDGTPVPVEPGTSQAVRAAIERHYEQIANTIGYCKSAGRDRDLTAKLVAMGFAKTIWQAVNFAELN